MFLFCRNNAGVKWVLFFQDTNGLLFKVHPLACVSASYICLGGWNFCFPGLSCWLWYTSLFTSLLQAIPASLGVSSTKGYHVNSLAVPRKAKEAIGGITKLTHADGNLRKTICFMVLFIAVLFFSFSFICIFSSKKYVTTMPD